MDHKSAFSLYVYEPDSGKRLDVFIAEKVKGLSRSFASHLIKSENIRVDDRPKKSGYIVKAGNHITGIVPESQPCAYLPEPLELSIIYEDDQIIVVNKPPGMVVHPAPGHSSGTLVNALLYHCPDLAGIGGEIRPGIVHRLDKDTSGVLVIAKTDMALQNLSEQFKNRKVIKEYVALVTGEPASESGVIELPIGRHPSDRKKMSPFSKKRRLAKTEWEIMERFNGFSLLRINLKTGRTHQIRVHCTAIGHPVVGDPVYGRQKRKKGIPRETVDLIKSVRRQLLHAGRLTLTHPQTQSAMSFEAEIPPDMAEIINCLRALHNIRNTV